MNLQIKKVKHLDDGSMKFVAVYRGRNYLQHVCVVDKNGAVSYCDVPANGTLYGAFTAHCVELFNCKGVAK